MKEWFKKNQIVLVLAVMVVIMSVIKFSYKYDPAKDKNMTPVPLLSPTPLPTSVEAVVDPKEATEGGVRTYESDYPLWSLLPFSGKGFVVDRYLAPRKLAVKAKGLDKKIATEEIEKWLGANDIDPTTHEIEFIN
ncbi:MAG: hypothetical protein WCT01_04495 [Candidatus Shapirobacteria bacterium]